MSAYVVDPHHVVYLVRAAGAWEVCVPWRRQLWDLRVWSAQEAMARVLWATNVASVCHRYGLRPDAPDLPGARYVTPRDLDLDWDWSRFDPVQVLKSVACYAYQSCELPHWELTLAAAFCRRLEAAAIPRLHGWEGRVWGAPWPEVELSGNIRREP